MHKLTHDSLNMAQEGKTLEKPPRKSHGRCGIAWKDQDVKELIELMKETISFSLEYAKIL